MAKCEMNIDFDGNADDLISKAKAAIIEAEGEFEGDTASGDFSIPVLGSDIVGNYTITGNTFNISITDKPLLISCRRIEDELREYIDQEKA